MIAIISVWKEKNKRSDLKIFFSSLFFRRDTIVPWLTWCRCTSASAQLDGNYFSFISYPPSRLEPWQQFCNPIFFTKFDSTKITKSFFSLLFSYSFMILVSFLQLKKKHVYREKRRMDLPCICIEITGSSWTGGQFQSAQQHVITERGKRALLDDGWPARSSQKVTREDEKKKVLMSKPQGSACNFQPWSLLLFVPRFLYFI